MVIVRLLVVLLLFASTWAQAEIVLCDEVVSKLGRGYQTQNDKVAVLQTTPVPSSWRQVSQVKGWQILAVGDSLLSQCYPQKLDVEGLIFQVWPVVKQTAVAKDKFAIVTGKLWIQVFDEADLQTLEETFPVKLSTRLARKGSASYELLPDAEIDSVIQEMAFSPLIKQVMPMIVKQRYRLR